MQFCIYYIYYMFVHINSRNDVRNNNETMIKRYVKQKVKHKTKLYLTHVSVRRMKEQHDETKCSVKHTLLQISFFLRFTERFVSLCCSFICRTDTRVEYSFILCFTFCFTCRFIIISYIVSIIYMYEHIVYIVDTELYCSLASL